ncbi:MAG: VCBS repeat-containing protein, partial [Saprospiraceae bacterium]|nr:VCBS repeat-containing protein [Saprospiraceae bacterium]
MPPPISGYTEVNVSVGENGESRVNIPIAVPKGTVLAPELAIGYSSQSSNGLLGQGFQLEGLYSISRQAANNAQDGFIDGIDFDNNDRFALNGERLVRISGPAYGGDGTEYKTEQNNFSRVRSYGSAGIGPSFFKVWTKSGLVMEFGNTGDSRIEAQGKSEALTWMVNKITDTKGNYITFTYLEENTKGEFRIDKIQYTGNTAAGLSPYNLIQFTYEARPDSTVSYLSGSKIGLSKRLKEITVNDNGVQYRRYELAYFPSTDLGLGKNSFLYSVKEFGVGNAGFEPTIFKWTPKNVFPTQENTFSNAYELFKDYPDRIRIGDVTGDGKADVILGPHPTNHEIYVLRSTGSSFIPELWGTAPSWEVDQRAVRIMDMNGDGMMDMMGGPLPDGKWEVKLSQGNSFSATLTWHPGIYAGFYHINHLNNVRNLDMDGDGLQDILLGPTEYGDWPWLRNTGSAFVNMGNAIAGVHGYFAGYWDKIHVSDATGDGLPDIVIGPHSDGKWFVIKNTGGALMDAGVWLSSPYGAWFYATDRVWQMDFNGDGLEEFILGPDNLGKWYALKNTGNGFNDLGAVATGLYGSWDNKANRIHQMDLNGDGLTDFLFGPRQDSAIWNCMYNTGKGFELGYDNGVWLYGYTPGEFFQNWWNKTNLTRQMDMNGDGVFDICFGPEPGTGKWEMMSNRISENHPLLLESVTNGHGATTSLVYEELTRPDVYQKGTGAVFPKMDFIAPLYVVTQVRSDNGIGGTNTLHYKYYDAKLDLNGRGFRGFGKTEQIDSLRGTKNVVVYERQHQYLSTKVGATEQWLLNYNGSPKLLHSTETTLDTFEYFSEKVHFSFVENSTENWYDLNSTSAFKTKVTSTVFDRDWGNVTQMTEEHKVGTTTQYTVVTNNTYAAPDTIGDKWILGRLTLASVTKTLAGKPAITKQSTFAYDASSGLLTQEILNSTSSTLKLQKDYGLDAFGNRITETVSGPGITSRTTTFTYDTKGRLVTKVKNPLNQESLYTYQNGLPQSMTDPNGLSESTTRDAFGRPTTVFHPDGTQTSTNYYKCDGTQPDCPQYGVYYVETEKAGNGKSIVFYDLLDREIRKVDYGMDGQIFRTDTEYDELGLVTLKSDAYRDSPTWHEFEYDVLFRLTEETAPGNLVSTMTYAGLTTTSTNAQMQNDTR